MHIRGDGVAARCCEHLLRQAGIEVSLETDNRPRLPAIMLGESSQSLIRDVFQNDALFRDAFRINQRAVAWNRGSTPATLPHSAVVVSEATLLDAIQPPFSPTRAPSSAWTIHAAPPLPPLAEAHRFGSRNARGVRVELKPCVERNTCWIEAISCGWLFLIPDSKFSCWLLAIGGLPETLLGESRMIAPQIQKYDPAAGEFAASPRIASPLCGQDWIACGTAAMAFDPLCGDGTANAIREAILASAVIRASLPGEDVRPLLRHYTDRLIAGFARHLTMCRDFYRTGHGGPWWEAEVASTDAGLAWCARQTEHTGGFHYRLRGFELEPIT